MKISLNMGPQGASARKTSQARILEADILAAKRGDWNAKNNLVREFMPLLQQLAEKRSTGGAGEVGNFIEAGKEGLFEAARKYKPAMGSQSFQIFALDFIEARIDRSSKGGGGFFAKLFGR